MVLGLGWDWLPGVFWVRAARLTWACTGTGEHVPRPALSCLHNEATVYIECHTSSPARRALQVVAIPVIRAGRAGAGREGRADRATWRY